MSFPIQSTMLRTHLHFSYSRLLLWLVPIAFCCLVTRSVAAADPPRGEPASSVLENSGGTGATWTTIVQQFGQNPNGKTEITINATGKYDVLILAQVSAHLVPQPAFFRIVVDEEIKSQQMAVGVKGALTGAALAQDNNNGKQPEGTVSVCRFCKGLAKGPHKIALQSQNSQPSISGAQFTASIIAFEIVPASEVESLKEELSKAKDEIRKALLQDSKFIESIREAALGKPTK